MSSPENITPAMKPSTPKMRGNGASALKPNNQRGTLPATAHATAQVKPIPIAPRIRRIHFPMIASDPGAALQLSISIQSSAKDFVLQSISRWDEIQDGMAAIRVPNAQAPQR